MELFRWGLDRRNPYPQASYDEMKIVEEYLETTPREELEAKYGALVREALARP
jgi:hypothetical protein